MNKIIVTSAIASLLSIPAAHANPTNGVGVGVHYGLIEGAALELNYPINEYFQVRGNFSMGAGLSETESEDGIDYKAEADGGVHRLAINYHPFAGNFFFSAGYAVNNFQFDASGYGDGLVTVGNDPYTAQDLNLTGTIAWDDAPVLSLGWGHSPESGFGAFFEAGVMFTGTPKASLTASGKVNGIDVGSNPDFQKSLNDEEVELQEDVADANVLPVIQLGLTYRF